MSSVAQPSVHSSASFPDRPGALTWECSHGVSTLVREMFGQASVSRSGTVEQLGPGAILGDFEEGVALGLVGGQAPCGFAPTTHVAA